MRGEDRELGRHRDRFPETPPHAWGRLDPETGRHPDRGNTPTCVGKTSEEAPAALAY